VEFCQVSKLEEGFEERRLNVMELQKHSKVPSHLFPSIKFWDWLLYFQLPYFEHKSCFIFWSRRYLPQKLEDAVITAKKKSLYRQMQLTKVIS